MSDSEFDSESDNEIQYDPIDVFIFNESDSIIDLYDDLKNRVSYFFGNTSLPLYKFLLNHISKDFKPTKHINEYFINEFNKEIQVTLDTTNKFLLNRKKSLKCGSITLKDWQVFCYENFI
jgi:hypothetical protein